MSLWIEINELWIEIDKFNFGDYLKKKQIGPRLLIF